MTGIILAVISIWLLFMPLHFHFKRLGKKGLSLVFKAVPTAIAAGAAAFAYLGGAGDSYGLLVLLGLCICVLADVMLDVRFEVGGALFFVGHIFYVLALGGYRALSWWCLGVGVVSLAGLWCFALRYRTRVPKPYILWGVMLYAVALAALLGFSLPLPFLAPSARSVYAALGAALFVLSDVTLCHNTLTKAPVSWHYASLGAYYMGQLFLGLSVLYTV